jgi:hypothetical protein
MASTGSCNLQEATLEELKREVERLSRELDQAVSEKNSVSPLWLGSAGREGRPGVKM